MPVIIKAVLDNKIDDRFACLISDDTHPIRSSTRAIWIISSAVPSEKGWIPSRPSSM